MSKKTITKQRSVELDQHVRDWLDRYRNPRTRDGYERTVRQFHLWLRDRHIPRLEVTREHVQAYTDHIEHEGRAPGTISGTLATLTSFYDHLIELDVYTKNPAKRVPRPIVPTESSREAPSLEQVMTMNDLAAIGPDPREHLLLCLLFFNALRVEEALSITVGALQHKNGRTQFQFIGKGGKPALITLPDEPTVRLIDKVRGEQADPSARLIPWTRDKANRIIQDLAKRAGIHDVHVTPHSLRHAAITIGLDRGMPMHEVQAMARHSNSATTWRYYRGKQQAATKVADNLADVTLRPYAHTA